ncbi:MAG: hypothetical protein LBG52_07310 [Candidatus Peribacteria bacterium]|nr:hypothetical protein [Candidatus Peribacteria bacterium]
MDTSSLKYQWTTATIAPVEGSFITPFFNGEAISKSDGTAGYYLWILAKDNVGNMIITGSEVFNIDNTAPVISSVTVSPTGSTSGSVTVTVTASDEEAGLDMMAYSFDDGNSR